MRLTVEMTMSIITEMGSSRIPMSKCRLPSGSQVKLKGTIVWKMPFTRSAVKYWKAVRYDRTVTSPSEQVPMSPATLCFIFMPARPSTRNDSSGRRRIQIVYPYCIIFY